MVDLNSKIKDLFPELYTKKGKLIKREPYKYECINCRNSFNKTRTIKIGGIGFGIKECAVCGNKGKDSISYNIWKRASRGEIEQEDFILNLVVERGVIDKEVLLDKVYEKFGFISDAIGTLVYFGYLTVDKEKRDTYGIIEYSIGDKTDIENRFEAIR